MNLNFAFGAGDEFYLEPFMVAWDWVDAIYREYNKKVEAIN